MKTLFLLCSSIILKKPILKKHKIDLQYGEQRIKQYQEGFKILKKNQVYKYFDKSILIDNTIGSRIFIPKNIQKVLDSNLEYYLFNDNDLGILNKGAGVLDSLGKVNHLIKQFEYIIYFEPRLLINDNFFFETIKANPRNLFNKVDDYPQVKSGYFSSNSQDLIEFIESVDISRMIKEKHNLENLMFDFYIKKNSEFISGCFTKRFDATTKKFVDY